ncbi:hypothetical protein JJB07_06150 [Tumebacillus sp. ITR2]|uniref:DUF2634 domain-containing protein n=1 Tax=Tumebacillus amylolyticus TaxID=2801339 RepID=A0ABS1J9B8_9BACL|nr:hypothetical protein [Tumebacillus amylolyticus]MBL0386233.1 hypothetical protein [Tumebacillus amylolyticus]
MADSMPVFDPLGTDLRLDESGDLVSTISGSLDLVSVEDNVNQAMRVRLQTVPSTYLWGTDVGTSLARYVDEPVTDLVKREIQSLAAEQVSRDSRILGVQEVSVDEVAANFLHVTVRASVAGLGAVQLPVRIGR